MRYAFYHLWLHYKFWRLRLLQPHTCVLDDFLRIGVRPWNIDYIELVELIPGDPRPYIAVWRS